MYHFILCAFVGDASRSVNVYYRVNSVYSSLLLFFFPRVILSFKVKQITVDSVFLIVIISKRDNERICILFKLNAHMNNIHW